MSDATPSLGAALAREIDRRAKAWMNAIAAAPAHDRDRATGKGAADLLTWLMIGHALGWDWTAYDPATVSGLLSLRLESADLRALPETAEHWDAMLRSARATRDTAIRRLDGSADRLRTCDEIRWIAFHLQAAYVAWRARQAQPKGEAA